MKYELFLLAASLPALTQAGSSIDLLYAQSGSIFRLPEASIGKWEAIKLIDLSQERFKPLKTPEEYRSW